MRRREARVAFAIKGQETESPKLTAAENLFCVRDFYTLPSYKDPVLTGALVHIWSQANSPPAASKPTPEDWEAHMRSLAVEYSRDGILRPDVLERMLAEDVDGPFDDVIRRLTSGGVPDDEELSVIRRFLYMLHFRSPAWFASTALRRMKRQVRRQSKLSVGWPIEAADHALLRVVERVLNDGAYLITLAGLTTRCNVLDRGDFALCLLEAADSTGFVITDTAGRPYDTADDPRRISSGSRGIGRPGVQITFPIGPRHCISLFRRAQGPRFTRHSVTDIDVRRINTALLSMTMKTLVFPGGNTDVFLPGVAFSASQPWREK